MVGLYSYDTIAAKRKSIATEGQDKKNLSMDFLERQQRENK